MLLGFSGNRIDEFDLVGLVPSVGGGTCNRLPLQGNYSDCFDQSNVDQRTRWFTFDATVGKALDLGSVTLLPFFGLRALWLDQRAAVEYLFDGGFEAFVDRDTNFSGVGVRVGLAASADLGDSFFVAGSGAFSQLFGDRRLDSQTVQTDGGVIEQIINSEMKRSIQPWSVDADLKFGYRTELLGKGLDIVLGYQVEWWNSLLDTRNTQGPTPFPPAPPTPVYASFTLGSKYADFIAHGPFMEVIVRF